MKTQTRVVVIGGGIAGCSTWYHLTQEDWSGVVLIERDELTSGTTWHSAAQVPNGQRPAGRMAKAMPLTPVLAAGGADFAVVSG